MYIDQSQSLNIYAPSNDGARVSEIYKNIHALGIKTTYYLRSLGNEIDKISNKKLNQTQAPASVCEVDVL